jgi:hypothetical protein
MILVIQKRNIIRLASATATALLLAGISVSLAPAAGASANYADCVGTTHETYNPGLLFSSQETQLSVTTDFTTCTSSDPTLTTGGDSYSAPVTASCIQPLSTGSFIEVVHWNNGESSTFSLTITAYSEVGGQIIVAAAGSVTAGEFSGAIVADVTTVIAPDPIKCLTTGVTSISGIVSLTIT